jgi:signal transduction histidine kinase
MIMVEMRSSRLVNIAVYGIVILLAGINAFILKGGWMKAAVIALCLAFCLVHAYGFSLAKASGKVALYFILQGSIVLVILRLSAPSDIFILLFYILTLQASTALPTRLALAWIAGFYLLGCLNMLWNQGMGGIIYVFFYAAAFLLTLIFGYTLRQVEIARSKNEELLEKLRTTQRQLQELAVSEERNRMAREMHDSLGHRLTVSIVQLEGAQRLIPIDPERAARMVGTMRDEMKEALAELRHTVSALRTPIAGGGSLDSALSSLTQAFQQNTGISMHFTVSPGFPDLPETHRTAFYRAAQEALTNIQRHAMARNAWLRLCADDHHVTLTTEDDGKGMDRQSESRTGSGLLGLSERAEQLGGEIQVLDREGGGSQLIFSVPLPKKGMNA